MQEDWHSVCLRDGQRHAEVRVEGVAEPAAAQAAQGRTDLALEKVVDEAAIASQVVGQHFCSNVFICTAMGSLES